MEIAIGIVLLVASLFLIVSVLMQSGKSANLSGAISGGAETFFGKTKGQTIDKMLSKVTTIVAIVFVILVLVFYMLQGDESDEILEQYYSSLETTDAADTSADTEGESAGSEETEGEAVDGENAGDEAENADGADEAAE